MRPHRPNNANGANDRKNDLAAFAVDRPYWDSNRRANAQDWLSQARLSLRSAFGKQTVDGFQLAPIGKIGRLDIEVIIVDEELKPDAVMNKVETRLDRGNIDFVVGSIFSNILLVIDKPVTDSKTLPDQPQCRNV
jgi:hypothetical protein